MKTTGIFCRPSCRSKPPRRENVEFFARAGDACAKGLRPCKRCRPDLLAYQPALELSMQAKQIFDTYFADQAKLSEAVKSLSVSQNHLIRLFRQQFGVTPAEYVNALRLKKAVKCLSSANFSVLDIAFHAGFGSLSGFYARFRKHFGMSPAAYRRKNTLSESSSRY